MKKALLLAALMLAAQAYANAQASQTAPQMNMQQREYHNYLLTQDAARRAANEEYLKAHPEVAAAVKRADGTTAHLHHIDGNGLPVYHASRSNVGLATSVKTTKLWPGGGLGLSLNGAGMEVSASRSRLGMWEPEPTRTTHQEFGGRAIQRDAPTFSTQTGGTDHATHVACTMIGSGVDAQAKGMSYGAKLDCYETGTNELAEILQAGSEGMLVSNHSYGPTFSATNTQVHGYYDAECRDYDSLSVSNKSHLIVMAAGNDRDESQNIRYDILQGGAIAKNVLSVGAVKILGAGGYTGPASVEISDFSSYGPTDDGRVKPDITAPGVQIYSAYSGSNTDYKAIDGTSMASPGVAGSLFLLQQEYKALHNSFMHAATLKGLAIHTADEAGAADGPDYQYGWGLLDMEKAINVIRNDGNIYFMSEATLSSGTPYKKYFSTAGGAFKATISWTDPAGHPVAGAPTNNRTPMLVNDLDLRVMDSATSTAISTLPWKLDPANPASAATHGDNVVDNVEQIWVSSLPAGKYYIQVSNKGSLQGGSQEFSVFASGVTTSSTGVNSYGHNGGAIMVSPLPSSSLITIANTATVLNGTPASIIDMQGREVTSFSLQPKQQIDIHNWANGIYTLRLMDGTVLRIVKQ